MDDGHAAELLRDIEGFDWDEGNREKNWRQHRVDAAECEEVFFNKPLLVHGDQQHSRVEQRFQALGRTDKGRMLFIAFTIRRNRVCVISARDQSDRERREYAKAENAATI